MSMPHPRAFIIPFGAVITSSKIGKHTRVEIYTDKTEIEKLHPALAGLGSVITKHDDLPPSRIVANAGAAAMLARKTIFVHKKHNAFMVKKGTTAAKTAVPAADHEKPLKIGWYYWLEPN